MRLADIRPRIRFADRLEYVAARPLSCTYDSRLLYVISGEGEITVGGLTRKIEQGLLVIFQSGVPYKFSPEPSFTAFAVDFDLAGEHPVDAGFLPPVPTRIFDSAMAHERVMFTDSSFLSSPLVEAAHHGTGERIRELVGEYRSERRSSRDLAELMLGCLLLDLERSYSSPSKAERTASSAVDYISEHYLEPISNISLARALGHDPCYLGRVVKLYTGATIHGILIKKRIEVGVKLLLTTDLTLDAIAERTGFCSAAHFSRRCKQITGNAPSSYRKSAR